MIDQKATGVFVRLPLSDEHRELMVDAAALGQPDDSHDKAILTIGTPVTDGELEVVGYAPGEDLPLYGDDGIDDTCFTEISLHRQADNDIPLIRQSDALAKLAEKDAEIARLRDGLARIEKQADEYPGDDASALGWIVSECDALKGPEA